MRTVIVRTTEGLYEFKFIIDKLYEVKAPEGKTYSIAYMTAKNGRKKIGIRHLGYDEVVAWTKGYYDLNRTYGEQRAMHLTLALIQSYEALGI